MKTKERLGCLFLAAGIAVVGLASRNEGLTVLNKEFSIKLYDPYPNGRHELEGAFYMFGPSDEPGQKIITGVLLNLSEKHALRINYIEELVPQSFISRRPSY